jgi:hypothetical protein
MKKTRRWQIALCERGIVHLHYGTGSLHILKEDFVDLTVELQRLANDLDVTTQENGVQKKGLLQ